MRAAREHHGECWGRCRVMSAQLQRPRLGLPRRVCPAPRGRTLHRAWRRPYSSPRAGCCRGPRAAVAAPPRTGVPSPRRARGQRWVPGGMEGRRRRGAGSAARSRSPWGRRDSPGRRGGCGPGRDGRFAGAALAAQKLELRVPSRRSNGSSPAAAALQGRAAQAAPFLCGDRKETYAAFWSASSISLVKFFIEKENLTELPLFLQ